jgi:hypothetical protein
MNLDDVLAIKADLQRELFGAQLVAAASPEAPAPAPLAATALLHYAAVADGRSFFALPQRRSVPVETESHYSIATPALGVARRGEDYLLAVRVQTEDSDAIAPFLDYLADRTDGNLDVRSAVGAHAQMSDGTVRSRPLVSGASIGRADGTNGTLSCFVRREGRDPEGLSVNHVLAAANRGVVGDEVIQPCTVDGGAPSTDRVGHLSHFHPLFQPPAANVVDVALCTLEEPYISGPLLMQRVDPDDLVAKMGRTTKRTEGVVTANLLDGVTLDVPGFGAAIFNGLFEVEGEDGVQFSDDGDSGALIADRSGQLAAGILVGGDGTLSWAIPLQTALGVLGAVLV